MHARASVAAALQHLNATDFIVARASESSLVSDELGLVCFLACTAVFFTLLLAFALYSRSPIGRRLMHPPA